MPVFFCHSIFFGYWSRCEKINSIHVQHPPSPEELKLLGSQRSRISTSPDGYHQHGYATLGQCMLNFYMLKPVCVVRYPMSEVTPRLAQGPRCELKWRSPCFPSPVPYPLCWKRYLICLFFTAYRRLVFKYFTPKNFLRLLCGLKLVRPWLVGTCPLCPLTKTALLVKTLFINCFAY